MAFVAAFGALLRGLTGQDDLVIGTDIANRSLAETENLIGFFINQLALRLDLSGRPSFREMLARLTGRDPATLSALVSLSTRRSTENA